MNCGQWTLPYSIDGLEKLKIQPLFAILIKFQIYICQMAVKSGVYLSYEQIVIFTFGNFSGYIMVYPCTHFGCFG